MPQFQTESSDKMSSFARKRTCGRNSFPMNGFARRLVLKWTIDIVLVVACFFSCSEIHVQILGFLIGEEVSEISPKNDERRFKKLGSNC